jgi:hypothetical protein
VQKQNILPFFSLRINRLNQLIVKLACLMQHRRKYQAKILMKVRVLKLKNVNSKMFGSLEFLWLIIYDYSSDVMSCDVCRKAGPDIAGKTEFVTGKKKFKCESLVYHNKSQKHEKCFNVAKEKRLLVSPNLAGSVLSCLVN